MEALNQEYILCKKGTFIALKDALDLWISREKNLT